MTDAAVARGGRGRRHGAGAPPLRRDPRLREVRAADPLVRPRPFARAGRRRTPTRRCTSSTDPGRSPSPATSTASRPARPSSSARERRGRSTPTTASRCCRCSSSTPSRCPNGAHAVVDLAHEERRSATASRQFSIGLDPDVGCMSVTQFVGFIPPGRAPDHFHRYDEVLYVLEGEGALHIDGEQEPLAPGSCVHLPARLVHCLENTGDEEMRVLRRLPAGRLARRGLLPRRHARRLRAGGLTCRGSSASPRSSGRGTSPAAPGRSRPARGAFAGLPYTLASRVEQPEGKTSPEELLAAAHGGCFTMSLAGELTGDRAPARACSRRRAGS